MTCMGCPFVIRNLILRDATTAPLLDSVLYVVMDIICSIISVRETLVSLCQKILGKTLAKVILISLFRAQLFPI